MDSKAYYMSLPHDLAGSRSKNRFKTEILWGISKMLDLIKTDEEFTVVFDYACDIEIHYNDKFEFHQVKTHSSKNTYTLDALSKIKGEGSILGKLYVLNKNGENQDIKLAIVSNVPLKDKMKRGEPVEYCWIGLSDVEKEKLASALKNELDIDEVDFSRLFYIQTTINLENPENEIIGKLLITFEKVQQSEPKQPNALYRLILDTATQKASYEFTSDDYEELLENKGINNVQLIDMFKCHDENANTGIKEVQEYIAGKSNVLEKRNYNKALASISTNMAVSKILKQLEKKVAIFLLEAEDLGDFEETVNTLYEVFKDEISIEYSELEKKIFLMIIIKRFECGVYDNENGI